MDLEIDIPFDVTVPEEEFRKILECAHGGLMLPQPCIYCNGMFKHRDWCPLPAFVPDKERKNDGPKA